MSVELADVKTNKELHRMSELDEKIDEVIERSEQYKQQYLTVNQ